MKVDEFVEAAKEVAEMDTPMTEINYLSKALDIIEAQREALKGCLEQCVAYRKERNRIGLEHDIKTARAALDMEV